MCIFECQNLDEDDRSRRKLYFSIFALFSVIVSGIKPLWVSFFSVLGEPTQSLLVFYKEAKRLPAKMDLIRGVEDPQS